MIRIECDQCGKSLQVNDELANKRCKCPGCGKILLVPEQGAAPMSEGAACPSCGSPVTAQQVICTNCGLDLRTGERLTTSLDAPPGSPPPPSEHPPPSLAGRLPVWAKVAVPAGAAIFVVAATLLIVRRGAGDKEPRKEPVAGRKSGAKAKRRSAAAARPGAATRATPEAPVEASAGPGSVEPETTKEAATPGATGGRARVDEIPTTAGQEKERSAAEETRPPPEKAPKRPEVETPRPREEERRPAETPPAQVLPVHGLDFIETENPANRRLQFFYHIPPKVVKDKTPSYPVLVCIPGLSGSGRLFVRTAFKDFAEKEGFIIVAPSFMWDKANWQARKSYQYPSAWSGNALIAIIGKLRKKHGLRTSGLYLYGFSAGAQFALRFALWKPQLCVACAAHAAGGTVVPQHRVGVKFRVTVGKRDRSRITMAEAFYASAKSRGINVTYVQYGGGHTLPRGQIDDSLKFFKKVKSALGPRRAATGDENARRMWTLANNFLANNMPEKARAKLREIVAKYPDTKYAEMARKKLQEK
jgi:poly(3-hydroxybutyrate) depolymerase/ribosomal protein S27E